MRKKIKTKNRTHQNTKQAEAPKIRKTRTEKITNPKSAVQAQETSWTERRFLTKHQNNKITTNQKKQRIPYSLNTYSKNIKQKHVLWTKEIHQRKKRTMIYCKGHFRKDPRKANKMR